MTVRQDSGPQELDEPLAPSSDHRHPVPSERAPRLQVRVQLHHRRAGEQEVGDSLRHRLQVISRDPRDVDARIGRVVGELQAGQKPKGGKLVLLNVFEKRPPVGPRAEGGSEGLEDGSSCQRSTCAGGSHGRRPLCPVAQERGSERSRPDNEGMQAEGCALSELEAQDQPFPRGEAFPCGFPVLQLTFL